MPQEEEEEEEEEEDEEEKWLFSYVTNVFLYLDTFRR